MAQHAHWLRLTWPDPTGDRLGACVHACAVRAAQAASDRSCPPGTCLPRRQRPRARVQTGGRLASGGGRRGDCKGERLGGVNKQRINLCFLGLRLHRNYYIFQERRLAPLRRWLRPALLKRGSHMHSSGSAGQICETHIMMLHLYQHDEECS